jgi:anti-sigma factor RsiW
MPDEPAEVDFRQPSPLEERLVAYLDGELDDAEARKIEQLLATDPEAREAMAGLDRTWALLDGLAPASVDEVFTRTTLEMVSVSAAEDVAQQQAEIPRRRRRRWLLGGGALAASGTAGFLAVALFWPSPNREVLEDLPVLEDLDEFQHVFSKDDDLRFLRLLYEQKLFVKDAADDS